MSDRRRPLVAGNWKMHKTVAEATSMVRALGGLFASPGTCEVVVAPPFTALSAVAHALEDTRIGLSAQDVYWEPEGAFTGEVSAPMLRDVGCAYCIVGHSERRQMFSETDEAVQRKVAALLAAGVDPIVCVGETLAEREAGKTLDVVLRQLSTALHGLDAERLRGAVLAYEPVWAIGTGRNASPADAQEVHAALRGRLERLVGGKAAGATRILYGGSVKPDNATALMAQPDIDGALVGGASLQPETFAAIARAADA